MPIDINYLREYKLSESHPLCGKPDIFREANAKRYLDPKAIDDVLAIDEEWRSASSDISTLRQKANEIQKNVIAPAKKAKLPCEEAVAEVKVLKEKIALLEKTIPLIEARRAKELRRVGNIVDAEVPFSKDEDNDSLVVNLNPLPENVSLPCRIADLQSPPPPTAPLQHDELLWRIDGYEPAKGVAVAGHRGYFLKNAGVMLNQALINYGIAFLRKREYEVLQPPYFMNKDVMAGIAQLDDFDEQLYKVSGKTDDPDGATEKYLIATSEQPICAYHKGDWLQPSELPKRYGGISTCFRKEAGSSGKDIRGIFRVHQFDKIEQFVVTEDDLEVSSAEQTRMKETAEEFYKSLGIDFRTIVLVSGELNDAAIKKYDLEGWFPGQNAYRELVSCSNCTDYQSRAMETRCGNKKEGQATASYCHFLNSTLCATGRGICCVLETHQTETGVKVPEVLIPFMGGIDFLPFVREKMEPSAGEKGAAKQKKSAPKKAKKAAAADVPPPAPKA
ncbi:hypothetical protein ScalyP_jg3325 [Parmales sp. scaly parma]|nr:hypothetical protein ScalyP_jg3325 [Parmales sp. scaly parma]